METILSRISLKELLDQPVMIDANILMVGIEDRVTNPDYSFERMRDMYMIPLLTSFKRILIHEEVYNELDVDSKKLIDAYKGKSVTIVKEGDLYGKDPCYTHIFNSISNNDIVKYQRPKSKNRGEVYSLAYASYFNVNYICSKDFMVEKACSSISELSSIAVVTFDIIILLSALYHLSKDEKEFCKGLRSIYKRHCEDVIKRHHLPKTLKEFLTECECYI